MVNKFVVALAGVVAVMALIVVVPRMYSPSAHQSSEATPQEFSLEYDRQSGSGGSEVLTVSGDGYATISQGAHTASFQLTSEEVSDIRSLVFDTGFMNIQPNAAWESQSSNDNATTDSIKVQSSQGNQNLTWLAGNSNIPPLVLNMQSSLDAIIAAHSSSGTP